MRLWRTIGKQCAPYFEQEYPLNKTEMRVHSLVTCKLWTTKLAVNKWREVNVTMGSQSAPRAAHCFTLKEPQQWSYYDVIDVACYFRHKTTQDISPANSPVPKFIDLAFSVQSYVWDNTLIKWGVISLSDRGEAEIWWWYHTEYD